MSEFVNDSMIEQSAERLFAGQVDRALLTRFEAGEFPQALWQLVVDQGLTLALASEQSGGINASWAEAYPILRGVGYWQVPLPLAETMIASLLLSLAGVAVPDGPIALVEEERDNAFEVSQTAQTGAGAGASLSGRAVRVRWASVCRWALVSLPASRELVLVDLHDAKSVQITARSNPATEPWDDLQLTGAPCLARLANPIAGLDCPLRTLGAIASSAMMVGAMEWLLEQSVQYATDRVQFGRPIGKNQAIQQQLALLAGEVAAARVAAIVACADAPGVAATDCSATVFSAAVAKIRGGEAATRAASIAHQVHGAIGFTYEHSLNFATRRLWAWREAYGADAWWAQRLGQAVIQGGAAGFWPAITARHLDALSLPVGQ
jgi:acyl-CoA dehydrogenase